MHARNKIIGTVIIILVVLIGAGFWLYQSNVFVNVKPQSPQKQTSILDTYVKEKVTLLAQGWGIYKPEDFKSVGDQKFPEIGACGSGIDAICNVFFKKGNMQQHLNVQIGGRNNYSEWMVVGGE
jgi:hypothetical protein